MQVFRAAIFFQGQRDRDKERGKGTCTEIGKQKYEQRDKDRGTGQRTGSVTRAGTWTGGHLYSMCTTVTPG